MYSFFYFISSLLYFSFRKKRKSKRSKHSGKNKLICVHLLANCLVSSEQRSCKDSITGFMLALNACCTFIHFYISDYTVPLKAQLVGQQFHTGSHKNSPATDVVKTKKDTCLCSHYDGETFYKIRKEMKDRPFFGDNVLFHFK